jgi:drug/metabolite transporter (DMT)-like permease
MAVAAQATEDRARLGILLMLGAWAMFSLVDTGAKWLALAGVPALQLAFMRYFGHLVISLGVSARTGFSRDMLHTTHPWAVISRALLLISATVSNFIALKYLPLTVTSAILFSSPVIVCMLSYFVLKEHVGPWRWFAIVLGFAGVLVVIRPFGNAFHPAMMLMVYNAFALAMYSIMTRKLAGIVATETMQLYMGLLGSAALIPFAIWVWESPTSLIGWAVLIGLGVFGWAGHQLLTNAHRFGSANTLMPFTYSFMIYVTILGYLAFGDVPDAYTLLGAGIIVFAGLTIWKREQR